MYNSPTIEEARKKRDAIITDYQDVAESAMNCLDAGFESAMTVMALPQNMRVLFRTSNRIERLNKELKRRSNVIGVFPNVSSVLRLMGAVLIERNDVEQARPAFFGTKIYNALIHSETPALLIKAADEQRKLLAA